MRLGEHGSVAQRVCVLLALAVLGAGCVEVGAPLAAAPVKARELWLSTYAPAEYHLTRVLYQYADDVEKATGGRIRIKVFPGETLTRSGQTYDGVAKGIADMGLTHLAYNPGRFPLMEVVDLPLPGVRDSTHASLAAWKVYQEFRPKELSDIKLLGLISLAGGSFFTVSPVVRLEDVSRLRIRGTGNDTRVIEALGGTAVALPITEAYVALQKGIVDGILTDDGAAAGYRFAEVVRYKVDYPGGLRQATAWYGINLSVWNSLTPDLQGIIANLSEDYMRVFGESRNRANEEGARYVPRTGVQITTLPAEEMAKWQISLQALRDKYVREKTAMGLPAREALDTIIAALRAEE